ncbi:MAG: HAMP domain-containing sensor histidine kinase [Patescibacteria group bacterium]
MVKISVPNINKSLTNNLVFLSAVFLAIFFLTASIFIFLLTGQPLYLLAIIALLLLTIIILGKYINDLLLETEPENGNGAVSNEILSFTAHELNAPLGNIKGALDSVVHSGKESLSSSSLHLLEHSQASVEQLIKLVNNLLTAAHFEQGKMKIFIKSQSIKPVLGQVIENYKKLVTDKGIGLFYQHPENTLPEVLIDSDRIREVIENLISNAVKYTEKGTVTIKSSVEKNKVIVSVTDSGIGIPEDKLSKLFIKYSRLSNTKSIKGTGLGLYIAKLIVEAHHGKIWVESKEGAGSTFSFSVPASSATGN